VAELNSTADSSAALRNDKQKRQLQEQEKLRKQIRPPRCGMTNKKGNCKNKKSYRRFVRRAAE